MLRPIAEHKKQLTDLAQLISATVHGDSLNISITGITHSSSEVEPGDLFCAFAGEHTHGAQYAADAVARGAVAVLTDSLGAKTISGVAVLEAINPRKSAAIASAWLFGEPMRDLFTVGITGTNGKTTVTTLCHQLMSAAGRESGLIGTIETRIGADIVASKRTTPEAAELQALAAVMRERHCRNLVMEVSSHAIAQERIRGAHFNVAAFTNLSQDHLDFHGTIEAYFAEKAKLFTFEYADIAFINIDDEHGAQLAHNTEIPVVTLSRLNTSADWHYTSIETGISRTDISVRGAGGILIETSTQLHGGYNLDNLLLAIAITHESGIDPVDIAALVPHLTGAAGRLESVSLGQNFAAFVDYAHSPDAVERVLATAREITTGRVIGILGCGGDRDRTKRPLMGQALLEGCDVAIFTSDNPRSEDPQLILDDMVKGLKITAPHHIIIDRAEAIAAGVAAAQNGDVLLLLGKGHEKGQEISGVIHPFDDRIALAEAIEAKP